MKLNKKALGFVVMSLMAVTTAVAFASSDQASVAPVAATATTEAVVVATEITEAAASTMTPAMPAAECTSAEEGNK